MNPTLMSNKHLFYYYYYVIIYHLFICLTRDDKDLAGLLVINQFLRNEHKQQTVLHVYLDFQSTF